jgi:hypothetical protein
MSKKDNIKAILDYLEVVEDGALEFDEEAIAMAYQQNNDHQSLSVKVLSVLGGVLAGLAFLGFLFFAGLYQSDAGLIVVGLAGIAGSAWLSRLHDEIVMDTLSVSAFIIGFMLLGFGLNGLKVSGDIISLSFVLIALSSIYIARNYLLSFLAVLIINGSVLMLMISNGRGNLIPIYIALLAVILAYVFLKEARIITVGQFLSKLYAPVRTGLMVSFLSALVVVIKRAMLTVSPHYIWLSTLVIISVIVYLLSRLFEVWGITEKKYQAAIYILTVLALLPTVLFPAISGAVLLMLLSFAVNYKTGLVLGIGAFVYFIGQYYYDLNLSLLMKSILLFTTGILFLTIYWFLYKKTTNEKI